MTATDLTTPKRRRARLSLSTTLSLIMLGLVLALAVLTPLWPGFDPMHQDLFGSLGPAFSDTAHPLGTDALGRDVLSRLARATQVSLLIAASAVAISACLGLALGLLAGWYRGLADTLLMGLGNIQLAIPVVLLLIVLVAALGASTWMLVLLLGLTNWVTYGRLTRSMVLSLRSQEFVIAARTAGATDLWILARHLLPNVAPKVLILAAFDTGVVIAIESSLSFIGLGVQPPTPSLGMMISEGQRYLQTEPHLTILPAFVIFCLIGGIQFAGQGLAAKPPSRG
ncbi:ABC transporter permease [Pseudooceanicola sediminis]|uniref:ABC transporter permease n=1 Tax=Pseudooceanicola sediminis TaxID=2211117 RepID=A0A399J2E9_9RHOB|nr:ABC transporter permease [Pseudooceanicola sediminis]KAA2313820.1 ABC transporter permease [Puniceibacterium sp. HSS470]RII38639.1 ABC transporter permease [Pseudooceanicola sediminis]|tara:strand:+ start:12416 stop:13264 length:849 start_codon:yes stop_codon:yes gene_type:complete